MQKGIAVPIILVSISFLIIGSFIYFEFASRKDKIDIKGISTSSDSKGFSVIINSQAAWDFYEYLCKDLQECKNSLTSGKRVSIISGAQAEEHELVINLVKEWHDYEYLKLYVSPVWGSIQDSFGIELLKDQIGAEIFKFDNTSSYSSEILIIPINSIKDIYVPEVAAFISR